MTSPAATAARPDPRRVRAAHLMLVVNAALIAIAIVTAVGKLTGPTWRDGDYAAIHTGFRIAAEGPRSGLYDLAVQADVQRAVVGQVAGKDVLPFVNPPHAALLGAPIGALDYRAGQLAWLAVAGALAALTVWRSRALTVTWSSGERRSGLVAVLATPMVVVAALNGTFSFVVLLACVGAVVAWRRGRDVELGAWLVLLSVKPQYVVLPLIALLAARRWRAVTSAAIGALIISALTTVVLGRRVWPTYLRLLNEYSATDESLGAMPTRMWNVRGLATTFVGSGPASEAIVLAALTVTAAWTAWRWWRRPAAGVDLDLALAALLSATVVTSPHTHSHDTLVLALAAALAWGATTDRRRLALVIAAAPVLTWGLLGTAGIAAALLLVATAALVRADTVRFLAARPHTCMPECPEVGVQTHELAQGPTREPYCRPS